MCVKEQNENGMRTLLYTIGNANFYFTYKVKTLCNLRTGCGLTSSKANYGEKTLHDKCVRQDYWAKMVSLIAGF